MKVRYNPDPSGLTGAEMILIGMFNLCGDSARVPQEVWSVGTHLHVSSLGPSSCIGFFDKWSFLFFSVLLRARSTPASLAVTTCLRRPAIHVRISPE